jgi:peptidoglycan/xylan/chitin deacetylase (PgdA/CDA1 family)
MNRPNFGVPRPRSWLRSAAKGAGARVARSAFPRQPEPALRILMYHRVNDSHPGDRLTVHPRDFERQMEVLASSGRPVLRLDEALRALGGSATLPDRAIAITFDDGFRDNFDFALPVLDRLRLPATFFIVTGHVGTDRCIERYSGCCENDRVLTWEHVCEMKDRGHEIGGHSRSHRELGGLPDHDVAEEVVGCRRDIEARGIDARLFCYPRGSEGAGVRRQVARAGFHGACTVSPGANAPGTDPFGLRRTEIAGEDGIMDFERKLDGYFDSWHRLVQGLQAWARPIRGGSGHVRRQTRET